MSELLEKIEKYWNYRAESYSKVVQYELNHDNEKKWIDVIVEQLPQKKDLKILDIGTGPGFFAIALIKRGYTVTAVDYTKAMLEQAKANAGKWQDHITWHQGDAHFLKFEDETFDVIVTRNLTWNLEYPDIAYQEWYRILRPNGIMINFDAGWYQYLFDKTKARAFKEDRKQVAQAEVFDFDSYEQGHIMEDISRKLILSRCLRPQEDIRLLLQAGFSKIEIDTEIWRRVWDDVEKINYASTPLFMIKAQKEEFE